MESVYCSENKKRLPEGAYIFVVSSHYLLGFQSVNNYISSLLRKTRLQIYLKYFYKNTV